MGTKTTKSYNVYRGASPATENRTQSTKTVKTTKKLINAATGEVISESVDVKKSGDQNSRVVSQVQQMMDRDEARFLARLRELEDALDAERDGRVRAEKLLAEMQFRYDQVSSELEEFGGLSVQQIEQTENALRKRHNQAVSELNDQIEHLTKNKT